MATITIDVPDALAEKLSSHQERLNEILTLGLGELSPVPNQVYQYILNFLASDPSPDEIIAFRPLPEMQERLRTLIAREKTQGLTSAERSELEEYERIEHLMVLLKANNKSNAA